jgi:hypothetical protein
MCNRALYTHIYVCTCIHTGSYTNCVHVLATGLFIYFGIGEKWRFVVKTLMIFGFHKMRGMSWNSWGTVSVPRRPLLHVSRWLDRYFRNVCVAGGRGWLIRQFYSYTCRKSRDCSGCISKIWKKTHLLETYPVRLLYFLISRCDIKFTTELCVTRTCDHVTDRVDSTSKLCAGWMYLGLSAKSGNISFVSFILHACQSIIRYPWFSPMKLVLFLMTSDIKTLNVL